MNNSQSPSDSFTGALASVRTGKVISARKLLQSKHRNDAGQFLAEGPQAVREALASGAVVEVFATLEAAQRHPELSKNAVMCDDEAIAAMTTSQTPQGIVAVCKQSFTNLETVLAQSPDVLVGLMFARDPGNAGAVLRVADAAGAAAVIFSVESVDPTNDKVVRASTGSIFHVPVVVDAEPVQLIDRARAHGMQVLVADASGQDLDDLIDEGALTRRTLWLMGNEAWGVPQEIRDAADAVVSVPIYGKAESLNLATAAAVCLYSSARAMRSGRTTRS